MHIKERRLCGFVFFYVVFINQNLTFLRKLGGVVHIEPKFEILFVFDSAGAGNIGEIRTDGHVASLKGIAALALHKIGFIETSCGSRLIPVGKISVAWLNRTGGNVLLGRGRKDRQA